MKGDLIPKTCVSEISAFQYTVVASSKKGKYTVTWIKQCHKVSCRNVKLDDRPCEHEFECNCPDAINPCKHIYCVDRIKKDESSVKKIRKDDKETNQPKMSDRVEIRSSTPTFGKGSKDYSIDWNAVSAISTEDFHHPLIGLVNKDFTCFALATLQVIFSVTKLNSAIMGHEHKKKGLPEPENCIFCAIKSVYKDATKKTGTKHSVDPKKLRKAIRDIWSKREQQDALEFLTVMLVTGEKENPEFSEKFTGFNKEIITCTICKSSSIKKITFSHILLNVNSSIETAVQQYYFGEETMEGDNAYACSSKDCCGEKQRATKSISLRVPPQVLCLYLHRFTSSNGKRDTSSTRLSTNVHLKDVETLFCYKLTGYMEHWGPSPDEGHYNATVWVAGKMYRIDDTEVRKLKEPQESSKWCTMLLYEWNNHKGCNRCKGGIMDLDIPPYINSKKLQSRTEEEKEHSNLDTRFSLSNPSFSGSYEAERKPISSSNSETTSYLNENNDETKNKKNYPSKHEASGTLTRSGSSTVSLTNTSTESSSDSWLSDEEREEGSEIGEKVRKRSGHKQGHKKKKKKLPLAIRNYDNYEGSFELKSCVYTENWDGIECKNLNNWRMELEEGFNKNINKSHCKFCFKNSKKVYRLRNGHLTIIAYGYCSTAPCKTYRMRMNPSKKDPTFEVMVHSAGKLNHDDPLTRAKQVKGWKRVNRKVDLRHKLPLQDEKEQIRKLSVQSAQQHNWGTVSGKQVTKKIRSEILKEADLAEDDFFDLCLKRRAELDMSFDDRFIQLAAEPLSVYLYSVRQVNVILNEFNGRDQVVVYFDATGKLVRKPLKDNKRILVYTGVVNVHRTEVPLFEMISSSHDQAAITSFMSRFRMFVTKECKTAWPPIGRVVVDCSFPLLHGILAGWNQMSLLNYLKLCYRHATRTPSEKSIGDIVLVHLCQNHFVKMTSMYCRKYSIRGRTKNIIMESIEKLMDATTLSEFDDVFKNFATVMLWPFEDNTLTEAVQSLSGSEGKNEWTEPKIKNLEEIVTDENVWEWEQQLVDSPFSKHCKFITDKIEQDIKELINDGTEDDEVCQNPYKAPNFIKNKFLGPHFAALIPLWTRIMVSAKGRPFVLSNADVEDYFKEKKHSIHTTSSQAAKVGRYVEKEREDIFTKIKAIQLNLRTRGIVSDTSSDPDDPRNCSTDSDTSGSEKWGKRKEMPKSKYRKGENTKFILEQLKKRRQRTATSNTRKRNTGKGLHETDEDRWKRTPKGARRPSLSTLTRSLKRNERSRQVENTPLSKSRKKMIGQISKRKLLSDSGSDNTNNCSKEEKESALWGDSSQHHVYEEFPKAPNKQTSLRSSGQGKAHSSKLEGSKHKQVSFQNEKESQCPESKTGREETNPNSCKLTPTSTSSKTKQKKRLSLIKRKDSNPDLEEIGELEVDPDVAMERSHLVVYREDLSSPNSSVLNLMNESEKAFIKERSDLNLSALVYLYGEDDKPIYKRDFISLLSDKKLTSSIIDNCLDCFRSKTNDTSIFVCSTLIAKVLNQKIKKVTDIPPSTVLLVPLEIEEYWIPLKLDFEAKLLTTFGLKVNMHCYRKILDTFLKTVHELWPDSKQEDSACWNINFSSIEHPSRKFASGVFMLHVFQNWLHISQTSSYQNDSEWDEFLVRAELAKACMESAKEYTKKRALKSKIGQKMRNGLFALRDYYALHVRPECVVGTYGPGMSALKTTDMNIVLSKRGWLNTQIIDAALHCLIKEATRVQNKNIRETYVNITDAYTTMIMNESKEIKKNFGLNMIEIQSKILLMPYNPSQVHWVLIVANIALKQYVYLDPFHEKGSDKHLKKFIKYLEKRNKYSLEKIETTGWTLLKLKPFPTQTDGYNCGLFVILFVRAILDLSSAKDTWFEDTTKARQDLADLLLRESEDVSHLCVICGMDEYRLFAHTKDTSLMIHCALCKRWVHAQCQRNFRGYEGNTSAALEKAECVLCKQYKVSFHMNFSTPPNPAAP